MLCIKSISLFQFRNYGQRSFTLNSRLTAIAGRNGTGKTNLLEAVYFCCFTKGYFSGSDAQLVQKGAQGMRIAAQFEKNGEPYEVTALIRETGKKEFRANGALCERMADHIGQLPAIVVAPDDVEIIIAGSEERRRFMDALFSQIDHEYLLQLMTYNRLLQQRNSLLKQQAETGRRQPDLMDVLDSQLAVPAAFVHQKRKAYLNELIAGVVSRYQAISGESYQPELRYETALGNEPFPLLLKQNRERDWQHSEPPPVFTAMISAFISTEALLNSLPRRANAKACSSP
ncbi:MAG: DNA replication and repair protein RecF [Flavihumibacter sp.]